MESIYQMVKQVTVFILLSSALIRLTDGTEYRKYMEFASGLIVIALVTGPVFSLFSKGDTWKEQLLSEIAGYEVAQIEQEMEVLGVDYEEKLWSGYEAWIRKDVADLCGVSENQCRIKIADGKIESIRVETKDKETKMDVSAEEIALRYGVEEESVCLITG